MEAASFSWTVLLEEDATPAVGFAKEPVSMATKKQRQVAVQPSSMRCVFFIVTLHTFLKINWFVIALSNKCLVIRKYCIM